MLNIFNLMEKVTEQFVLKLLKAPIKKTYILGQSVPSIWDVKRTYTAQMKELLNVAHQVKDQKAIDYATGVVDEQIAELEAALKEAKGK